MVGLSAPVKVWIGGTFLPNESRATGSENQNSARCAFTPLTLNQQFVHQDRVLDFEDHRIGTGSQLGVETRRRPIFSRGYSEHGGRAVDRKI